MELISDKMPKETNLKKDKVETMEFAGNVMVTISKHEVRLWVCNEEGQNIFRFKALGKVYNGKTDIMVMPSGFDD